jgi:hypothetical protein
MSLSSIFLVYLQVGMARDEPKRKVIEMEDALEFLPRGIEHGKFVSTRY